jgi:hypothetical protein
MNEHDRANLEFLLNASPAVIKDWMQKVSADDVDYAHELMAQYSIELKDRSDALLLEAELSALSTFKEANEVLAKFKL